MAFPLLGALVGLGLGGLKFGADKISENTQKDVAAATTRYSPWTGMKAQPVKYADPFGSVLSGVGTGMAMEQSFAKAAMDEERAGLLNKLLQQKISAGEDIPMSAWHSMNRGLSSVTDPYSF